MNITKFAIPKKIKLPGVTVKVKLVAPSKLSKGAEAESDYADAKPVILISKSTGLKRQRYLLYHELQHVMVDIMHVGLQDCPSEVGP